LRFKNFKFVQNVTHVELEYISLFRHLNLEIRVENMDDET